MQKILIKHVKGSKASQTESFELPVKELTFGRDTSSDIRFDPDRDDLVSRSHAKLAPMPGAIAGFTLTDLNSRNGTFVNGSRIQGTVILNPGDVVRLGETGPEMVFDIDPRPQGQPKPTRFAEAPPPPTRESQIPSGAPPFSSTMPSPSTPGSIGRNTVERLISETRSDTRKKIINIASVIVVLVLLVTGYLLYQSNQQTQTINIAKQQLQKELVDADQDIAQLKKQADAITEEAEAQRKLAEGKFSPTQIADEYSQSTVMIEASWKLIFVGTGEQIYHKVACPPNIPKSINRRNGCALPWYKLLKDAPEPWVEPWLITKGQDPSIPIGGGGQGSGFVVGEEGFILTNRHVASGWQTRYEYPTEDSLPPLPGYLCRNRDCSDYIILQKTEEFREYIDSLRQWVPYNSKAVGGIPSEGKRLEGRNDYLDVTFPNTRIRIPAQVGRVSDIADVAMIKISIPASLKRVTLSEGDLVQPGDAITVMGYPAVSPKVEGKIKSQDLLNRSNEWRVIPQPTVSASTIGKIITGEAKVVGNTISEYRSQAGDVYQLNLNTTGSGNSGGPVFNDQGHVIGLFTYGHRDEHGIQNSFAVPIKYGQEIMGVQSIIK